MIVKGALGVAVHEVGEQAPKSGDIGIINVNLPLCTDPELDNATGQYNA